MSVATQLQELQSILGSWPLVEQVTNLDERHRRRIINQPGFAKRVSELTRGRIAKALEQRRPFPLSDFLRVAREELTGLKASPGTPKLQNYLIVLEGFLNAHEPSDLQLQLEYKYMRMMVSFSKAHHHGSASTWFGGAWGEHFRAAQANAEEGLKLADAILKRNPKDERVAYLAAFIFINWIQIIQEQAKAGYKNLSGKLMTASEKEKLFRDQKALSRLKALMIKFPYLWQAAYNGLEQASTMREDDFALWFYDKLKCLDPGFQDFDYSPGEVPAISAEPAMAYFNSKYRDKFHVPNPNPNNGASK